ncbi:MAG: glycoside hydrolase family 2 TIM barrel-domain containing protein [Mariprofundales bacterium]
MRQNLAVFIILLFATLAMLTVGGCSTKKAETVLLDGTWQYHLNDQHPPKDMELMAIPSQWSQQGLQHDGVIWFYRRVKFDEADAEAAGTRLLSFQGVDEKATVYWDGVKIGEHHGYFEPFSFVIEPIAGEHTLAVRVDAPKDKTKDWPLRKQYIKGIFSQQLDNNVQPDNTGGIWGQVRLQAMYAAYISQTRVQTKIIDTNTARIDVQLRLEHKQGDETTSIINYTLRDADGKIVAADTIKSDSLLPKWQIPLSKPRLWWPYELQTQKSSHLYDLEIELEGEDGSDIQHTAVGVRSVKRDADGRFIINGKPIFLRGTQYIPSQYIGSVTAEDIERDIRLMQQANINTMRLTAHIAAPWLYELANKYGMMIWQDFPLYGGYEDSASLTIAAKRQMRAMITLLDKHPAIIAWNAHAAPPWSNNSLQEKHLHAKHWNRNLDAKLKKLLRTEDDTRPSLGAIQEQQNLWQGWYNGKMSQFSTSTSLPLVMAFGAQSLPNKEMLMSLLPAKLLWPLSDIEQEKTGVKNLKAWQKIGFQAKETLQIANVDTGQNLDDFIRNSQDYQARLLQFSIENLRLQKWQPVVGIFQYMFNDPKKRIGFGIVDDLRHPKQAYASLQRAYQPLLPVLSASSHPDFLCLHVINDGKNMQVELYIKHISGDKGSYKPQQITANINANDITEVSCQIPLPDAETSMSVVIKDAAGNELSSNSYTPGTIAGK